LIYELILVSTEKIKEIADQLDTGGSCYINKRTKEFVFLYENEDDFSFLDDEDAWAEKRKKVKKNPEDYHEIEKMNSRESFSVMTDFVETVDSDSLRKRLTNALNDTKPFRKFKYIIDDSGDYRQKWFAFKDERMCEWVKEQIDFIK
jgi:hypothetical protein